MPRTPLALICFLGLTVGAIPPVAAQAGTPATARALLDAMRAADAFIQGLEASIPAQKQAAPQLPAVFWDRILQHARNATPTFLDSLTPIYAARFSESELKELLRFYQSPIGKRLITLQPDLLEATSQLGYRWGVRLGADVAKELADEGIKLQ